MVEGRLRQRPRPHRDEAPRRVPLQADRPVRIPGRVWSRIRSWCVLDAFERDRHTVHLVCGDRLDPRAVVDASRRAGHRPREVLATSHVARAFTASQLATLVHDRLEPRLRGAHTLTVAEPLAMLAVDEVPPRQARVMLEDILDVLADVDPPVLVTQQRIGSPLRDQLVQATARVRADVGGLELPDGAVGWGPGRQATLDAYRIEVEP